ncbi:MAG: hypothetical protein ACXW3Z_03020 [Limisphaerales bacterium]
MKTNRIGYFRSSTAVLACGSVALLLGAGCGGSTEIKTYKVAKEDSHTAHVAEARSSVASAMGERPSIPHIHGDAAEGWQALQPEKMRVASYRITDGDKTAEMAVIPLPGVGKIELRSVNMWREELGLDELTSEQLKEQSQTVPVGDAKGLMVHLTGSRGGESNGASTGILGAVAERGNITWFIKMIGDQQLVAKQEKNFISYLKSLEFHEGAHGSESTAQADAPEPEPPTQLAQAPSAEKPVSANTEKAPDGNKPNFKAPENWKTKPPGQMIQSAYNIEGDGGQAEVTISKFPGAVGGMVANIQRWRGQLGLPPGSAEEAQKSAEMIEVGGKKEAYLVDLKGTTARTGKPARMVSVGVPFQGETWFFKLMGDDAVVGKEKDAFVRFIKSAY